MDLITIVLLALGLAMDAFAVSICKGMAIGKVKPKAMLIVGIWFGAFQALMPIIGYFMGQACYNYVSEFAHWIAFILLVIIGGNMIREALSDEEEEVDGDLGFKIMLLLAIATSIDALAVGISMAMDGGDIFVPALIIGIITMAMSAGGMKIGSLFGDRFGSKAEILGGIILIAIGIKVLLSGLGFF